MSQLLCSLQERNGGDPIPMVVHTCIEYLEKTGLNIEGIFRRTTGQSMVKRVKAQFNEGIKTLHNYRTAQFFDGGKLMDRNLTGKILTDSILGHLY